MTSSLRPRATALALALLAAMSLSAVRRRLKISLPPRLSQRQRRRYSSVNWATACMKWLMCRAIRLRCMWPARRRLKPSTVACCIAGCPHAGDAGRNPYRSENFGMTASPDGSVLYITNTLDGGVTKVDARSGKVLQRLLFGLKTTKAIRLARVKSCCMTACYTSVRLRIRR